MITQGKVGLLAVDRDGCAACGTKFLAAGFSIDDGGNFVNGARAAGFGQPDMSDAMREVERRSA